jgi:hypothetical protein
VSPRPRPDLNPLIHHGASFPDAPFLLAGFIQGDGQPEHHRRKTFQEEYRLFLERHNVACDERYMWD